MTDNLIVCAYIKIGLANCGNFQSKFCDIFGASGNTVFLRNVVVVKLQGGLVHAQLNGP